MLLGADGIYVELAGEAFELRPSLRACMRLVRRHGLPALLVAAQEFNTTIIADMLREAGIKPALLLAEIVAIGLGKVRNRLTAPLVQFVLAVAGIDPDDASTPAPVTGKPMTLADYYEQLFQTATGWLGWTPEQAWSATPAEIIGAKTGRTDLITDVLKAVFGSTEEQAPALPYTPEQIAEIEAAGNDPEFDRAGLAKLKAMF